MGGGELASPPAITGGPKKLASPPATTSPPLALSFHEKIICIWTVFLENLGILLSCVLHHEYFLAAFFYKSSFAVVLMEPSGNYSHLPALSQSCLEAGICDYGLYPPEVRFYMDQVDYLNSVFPSNKS